LTARGAHDVGFVYTLNGAPVISLAAFGTTAPFALAGGAWIFLGFVGVFLFAVIFGYYTIRGSGISKTPFRREGGPPESPSEVAHDITQNVRNWERGTVRHPGRHRPPG
jgi:hypothetical protein